MERTIYEIAINISSGECEIEPQTVLYKGELGYYAGGFCAEWGGCRSERAFSYAWKDKMNKEEIFKKQRINFWTDSLEKAENYKENINQMLSSIKELISA